jgi:hypothetical protein
VHQVEGGAAGVNARQLHGGHRSAGNAQALQEAQDAERGQSMGTSAGSFKGYLNAAPPQLLLAGYVCCTCTYRQLLPPPVPLLAPITAAAAACLPVLTLALLIHCCRAHDLAAAGCCCCCWRLTAHPLPLMVPPPMPRPFNLGTSSNGNLARSQYSAADERQQMRWWAHRHDGHCVA